MNGSEQMKNNHRIILSAIMIILMANLAFAFAGMGLNANNTTISQGFNNSIRKMDINNSTQSDQDIMMVQHLIELDTNRMKAQNSLFVRETLIFRNTGARDFFGNLRTWVPDSSENISAARSEMMTGGELVPVPHSKNGNIISWEDYIEKNSSLPFMYNIEYQVKRDSASRVEKFSKKFAVPTYISYKYGGRPDLLALVIKVTKQAGSSVQFFDENGNMVKATEIDEPGGIYRFSSPQFKEIDVEISESEGTSSGVQNYNQYIIPVIIIGILIVLVLFYPQIKKKLGIEDKGEEEDEETESGSEIIEDEESSELETMDTEIDPSKYSGKNIDELNSIKKDLNSKINDLDNEYESGNLLDEEYDDKKRSYTDELRKIENELKKMV